MAKDDEGYSPYKERLVDFDKDDPTRMFCRFDACRVGELMNRADKSQQAELLMVNGILR